MELITTPKSAEANAYLTLEEATTYLTERRLYASAWVSATDATKTAAIIWATQLLDQLFEFKGHVSDVDQALMWPRAWVFDEEGRSVDPDEVPNFIKWACAEIALAVVKKDRLAEPELLGQGFSEVQAGPVRIVVDPSAVLPIVPHHIFSMLAHYGDLKESVVRGSRVAKLHRS